MGDCPASEWMVPPAVRARRMWKPRPLPSPRDRKQRLPER